MVLPVNVPVLVLDDDTDDDGDDETVVSSISNISIMSRTSR